MCTGIPGYKNIRMTILHFRTTGENCVVYFGIDENVVKEIEIELEEKYAEILTFDPF